jgi:hypothetical protein
MDYAEQLHKHGYKDAKVITYRVITFSLLSHLPRPGLQEKVKIKDKMRKQEKSRARARNY